MKTVDKIISRVAPTARPQAAATPSAHAAKQSGGKIPNGQGDRDHIDVINQIFAEFELAYHNQFHKAYAQEGSLSLAKKYWLGCLADYRPEVILRAARQVVKSQEYLPTVASIVNACENAFTLFGLPSPQAAYVEACCAPEPRLSYQWSHPAVYLAATHTGWFALATETQANIFPVFEYNYQQLCRRVLQGEQLDISIPAALPETIAAPLSLEENRARMKALRQKFALQWPATSRSDDFIMHSTLKLQFLSEQPEHLPRLARWYFDEWGALTQARSIQVVEARLQDYLNADRIPLIIIGSINGELAGAVQLKFREMSIYPDKEHWLGGVYVGEKFRGYKIASTLVSRAVELARTMGVTELYLQTIRPDGGLYSKLGWKPVQTVVYRRLEVLVMVNHLDR